MEEILIVDRIENGYAVCETEQGEKKDIHFKLSVKFINGKTTQHTKPTIIKALE